MRVALLDVNALIALFWPDHGFHDRAITWFDDNAGSGWATCPLTQAGFVRIISNPAFSVTAPTPREAIELLKTNLAHPKHQFWPEDVALSLCVEPFVKSIHGHQQITDAYLLGMVRRRKGRLVTFDRGVLSLVSRVESSELIEVID
jgi:toxin-antitoxin system PIN domain toxin